jgi:hypothetical protein
LGREAVEHINVLHPLGGERRLVHWKTEDKEKLWECPDLVTKTLNETSNKNIRMVLATPALFRDGWKPGWLNDRLEERHRHGHFHETSRSDDFPLAGGFRLVFGGTPWPQACSAYGPCGRRVFL